MQISSQQKANQVQNFDRHDQEKDDVGDISIDAPDSSTGGLTNCKSELVNQASKLTSNL